MGNNSSASFQYNGSFSDPYMTNGYCSFEDQQFNKSFRQVTNQGMNAIWSARGINSIAPIQRIGHATAYSCETDHSYIAYGVAEDSCFLTDVWDLDMKTCVWRKLNIDESQVSPRAGARAVIVGTNLWIFGGFYNSTYIADLHVINIETGAVYRPETTGEGPEPCSGHSMTYSNGKIYIFGGYGYKPCFQCKVLDLQTLSWSSIKTNENKFAHGFCVSNGNTYLSGGSKVTGVIKIDHKAQSMQSFKIKGDAPPPTLTKSCLVGVGNYLVSIGGMSKKDEPFLPLYVYDTERNFWSILQVLPDNYTLTMTDGEIDQDGIFRLPACTDASAVYREKEREIAMFQGKPFRDPPVLIVISMEEALAMLNLRSDMLSVLNF